MAVVFHEQWTCRSWPQLNSWPSKLNSLGWAIALAGIDWRTAEMNDDVPQSPRRRSGAPPQVWLDLQGGLGKPTKELLLQHYTKCRGIRQRFSAALAQPMAEALDAARQQPVAYVDETGAPTGNADGCNPDRKRGWQWVMVTAVVTVFVQGLSRSTAAAIELLGNAFGGIVVSDRFSAYNHLPTHQRQLCWAHVIRDLAAIAERPGAGAEFGAELLDLQQQLFALWRQWKDTAIDWSTLQLADRPIHQAFVAPLQGVVELGCQRGERTPWAKTVCTCHKLLQVDDGLWTFLEIEGIEPTNNAAERALRQSVIQRKISHGVQSARGAICRSRLLTVTTTLRKQGRDVWEFLEQAWIAHHRGGVMPSLLPDP